MFYEDLFCCSLFTLSFLFLHFGEINHLSFSEVLSVALCDSVYVLVRV